MTTTAHDIADRQRWMAILARASSAELDTAWYSLAAPPAYQVLRKPEIGLAMVRGRAGGTGNPFNLGEMTVTRCAIRLDSGVTGHCYAAGRDRRKVELAAVFDALLQADPAAPFLNELIDSLAARQAADRDRTSRKAAATKVEFFTMVRGEKPK